MQKQRSYTRHGIIRTRFPRNPIWSYCLNDCWFADLHDLSRLSRQNRRKKFLLIVVDALSRFLYCEPLKNKTANVVLEALKKIVKRAGASPGRITVDAGSEFVNNKMKLYMQLEGIRLQIARAPLKASLAELMGKLLKNKIYRYMTHERTRKYIDHLQEFVDSLNSRPLKNLGGLRPKDVTYQNQIEVYHAQLGKYRGRRNTNYHFEVGDGVRVILKLRQAFTKGYQPSFTEEIYLVRQRTPQYPEPLYKLSDALGNPILGRYYDHE
ncbi:MAG: transposase family protein, partial [candidate division Zixibacteria bacterium]|nr:transposase family protein [candidate division Zixibacteria bacterium]